MLAIAAGVVTVSASTTYMLPMRDGVKLHTVIDEPPFFPSGKRVAAVLERSPYSAVGTEALSLLFGEVLGYISVRQDFRGTGQSEGNFTLWQESHADAYDTIDWIVEQPWSNGEVFTTGISADCIDE